VHFETLSRKQEQTKQKKKQAQAIKQQFSEQRRIKAPVKRFIRIYFAQFQMIANSLCLSLSHSLMQKYILFLQTGFCLLITHFFPLHCYFKVLLHSSKNLLSNL
jgi:lipopolysaccharide/colanic/teichoic acid biosynthesis glycosyltransferase